MGIGPTSIEEYLVAIASGITEAQRELNGLTFNPGPGSQEAAYCMPKVEFELKVNIEAASGAGGSGGVLRPRPKIFLRSGPFSPGGSQASTAQILSTIRGSFVSVPAHGGLPEPRLRTSFDRMDDGSIRVRAFIGSAAGEPRPGAEVHFNVDREQSREANRKQGFNVETNVETRFVEGIVLSEADGMATAILAISKAEPAKALISIAVDSLGVTDSVLCRAWPAS